MLALWHARVSRRALLPALLTLALWPLYAALVWNTPQANPTDAITLLTYNLAGATQGRPERLAAEIRAADADIVTLQETEGVDVDLTRELLALLPEYEHAQAAESRELLTLSRFPVVGTRAVTLPETTRIFLVTTLNTPQGKLTVINVHFSTVLVSRVLQGQVGPTQSRREAQLDILRRETAGLERVIVAGDFNTPPRGVMYRDLQRMFSGAWAEAGGGLGWTFPSASPALRIDHIFSRGLRPVRAEVLDAGGSDHRAVRAVLTWEG